MSRERIWRFGSFGVVIGRSAMGFQNYFFGGGGGKANHGSVQAQDQRVVAVAVAVAVAVDVVFRLYFSLERFKFTCVKIGIR